MKLKNISFSACLITFFLSLDLKMSHAQDGSLDLSFGWDGIVTTSVGGGHDHGYSIALQSDGKIVVAGDSDNGSDYDFALVRYNSDGSLDSTFDTDGIVTTSIGTDDVCKSVIVQSDGKILAAGYSNNGSDLDFAMVRYNNNGSLDSAFDSEGIVITPIGSDNDLGYSVRLQPDGKILVAGYMYIDINYINIALVRYNSNGSLDTTFNADGIVTTAIGSIRDYGHSVFIQMDGKIVVTGMSSNGADFDFALARYNSNGSLDSTFDTDGIVTTAVGSYTDASWSVILQSDGKIVVAGYNHNGADSDFALVRYNADGSLDDTFDMDGIVTTPVGSSADYGYSVTQQSDGKFVVAGLIYNGATADFGIVRYNNDGSLDNSFDTDGIVETPVESRLDLGCSVIQQSDGKIVVAGTAFNGTDYNFVIVRYNNPSVGIQDAEYDQHEINIFPNPTSDLFTLPWNGKPNATLQIFNAMGEEILQQLISSETTLSLPVHGIYVAKISDGENVFSGKIVVR